MKRGKGEKAEAVFILYDLQTDLEVVIRKILSENNSTKVIAGIKISYITVPHGDIVEEERNDFRVN